MLCRITYHKDNFATAFLNKITMITLITTLKLFTFSICRFQDTWGQPLNVVQMGFSDLSDFLKAAEDLVVVDRAAGRARGHKIIRLKPGVEGSVESLLESLYFILNQKHQKSIINQNVNAGRGICWRTWVGLTLIFAIPPSAQFCLG